MLGMYILIFVLGACWGSFLGLLSYRLPRNISIIKPSSFCEGCNNPIKIIHNIPIIGYFIAKGKCSTCGSKISIRYPILEFITGVFFLIIYQYIFVDYPTLIRAVIIITAILPSILIDMDYRIIPDSLSIGMIVSGLILSFFDPMFFWLDSLSGIIVGGGVLYVIAEVYYRLTGTDGLGGGDIKLMAGIGALMGWYPVVYIMFLSSLTGSLFGLVLIVFFKKDRKTAIAFGPFIGACAIIYFILSEGGWFFEN